MSFFNGEVAKKLSPACCHYPQMWLYDAPDHFDMSPMGSDALDRMIEFNNHTNRCFACLGKGANVAFGHGGPGEFFCRTLEREENGLIAEYETGVKAKVKFNPHFYHHYDHPVKTMDDLNRLVLPDPADPKRYEGFAQDVRYLKSKGEYVLGSINGFFSGVHYFLMDYQETLMVLLTEPKLVEALMERLGEWNIAAAKKMVEAGADCICLCDDLGTKKSLLMSPDLYRRFFKPWHKKLCEEVHALGGDVHFHCHGAITQLMDDLIDCHFDFMNPFDPEEKHVLEDVMKNYSQHFVVVGGFPTSFWVWGEEKQNAYLKEIADLGKTYGRLIFMDSGGVPENVTPEDFERINRVSRDVRGVNGVPGCV
jgi:uroporphyrinogen-III decarboxylase